MRVRPLVATLHGIVSLVLANAALASCNGSAVDGALGPAPREDGGGNDAAPSDARADAFTEASDVTCEPPLAAYTSNLRPVVAVDHVELRTQRFVPNPDGGEPATLDSESGPACATAQDQASCIAALESARAGNGKGWTTRQGGGQWPDPSPVQFLVYTRGSEVGVVDSVKGLNAFLGPIDTLEEARLVLTTASYPLTCETTPFRTGWKRNVDGSWEMVTNGSDCGNSIRLRVKVSVDGAVSELQREELTSGSVCGRRPEGLVAAPRGGAEASLGAWLAEAAHLEAASVIAFRRLERELRRLGAPPALVRRARRSRADEIRHAREMASLARRFGSEPDRVLVTREVTRTSFAIALENAVEGCVRETYGALVASYQARRAADPELRSVLERVARDEARHAELAHDVATFLEPRLTERDRAAIAEARNEAIAGLRDAISRAPAEDVARLAGMPAPRDARALLDLLEAEVLTEAA